jgi:anaerobic selenocysteine-containing dehydrogenase
MSASRTAFRTCPLCEATCGLEITLEGEQVIRIRGDRDDVFSHGFICPKGSTLRQLDADPDRLRGPLIRRNGTHVEATWEEAFAAIAHGLGGVLAEGDPNAVAVYLGNPNVHSMSGPLYNRVLLKALGSRNVYSASTVDQMPKHVTSGLMFGHPDLIPVPDIDRTDHLLMLGANPFESNGSLATAPDWPGRMRAISERGGTVVVVDPRRTRTAEAADEHVFIRPGTDTLLLLAMIHTVFDEGRVDPGPLAGVIDGLDTVGGVAEAFPPERVAAACGIGADTIRRLAIDLADAPTAVVYGRIGTHTTRFGTLASWSLDVLNVVTGNLDRPGGAMFPQAAHERSRSPKGWSTGRWTSRVREMPEVRGELPVATLADEITTPGPGRVRALLTLAGNPARSTPDTDKLEAAMGELEFMVSLDLYLNETTRHADVILPGTSPLRRPHYDFAFYQLAVRNIANYSPPALPAEGPAEWEILLRLAGIVSGAGPEVDIATFDDMVAMTAISQAMGHPASALHGRDPAEVLAATDGERGPDRLLDILLRTGPYGDGYGAVEGGLRLAVLQASPHGIDLGPLRPRLPEALATPRRRIDLAPAPIVTDVGRLEALADGRPNGHMVLVGRRHIRSNNSWMHNIDVLVKGRDRCTLQIHPDDATRLGIDPDGRATITSAAGSVEAPVEVTEAVMPGVVSLPHGWGHGGDGTLMAVAAGRPGVNANELTPGDVDPVSGNAALNGIPVDVAPLV